MEYTLPPDVRQFVRAYLRSLDQLEVLLVVSALPDREWTVDQVYRVVLSTPELVRKRLDDLVGAGLLSRTGEPPVYRYLHNSDELAQQISGVATAYKLSRHKIVELFYPRSSDSARDFSNAFKFKPDK